MLRKIKGIFQKRKEIKRKEIETFRKKAISEYQHKIEEIDGKTDQVNRANCEDTSDKGLTAFAEIIYGKIKAKEHVRGLKFIRARSEEHQEETRTTSYQDCPGYLKMLRDTLVNSLKREEKIYREDLNDVRKAKNPKRAYSRAITKKFIKDLKESDIFGIIGIASIGASLFFLSSNITGNVIRNLNQDNSNVIGACLFVIGAVCGLLYFKKN